MSRRLRTSLVEIGPFLLAGLIWLAPLLRDPAGFLFWRGGAYTDLAVSHWPDAFFIQQAIRTWREIPLWNPTILGGAPLAADPLTGFWYLPAWLAILLPPSLGFNLLLWLHLTWAGWGTYRLLRSEGVGRGGSVIAGLAFCGTPMLIGHAGLGHVFFVCSVSWTPWVLLAVSRAVQALGEPGRRWAFCAARAGAVLGVVFLADPRWALPAGLLGTVWAARALAHSHEGRAKGPGRPWGAIAIAGAFTASVAAGLALPLLEFVALSTRAGLTPADQVADSLPPARLLGIVAPDLGGWPEWATYVGLGVLVLAVAALAARPSRSLFWACVAFAAAILALGSATPTYAEFAHFIPGFDLLRVPARFMLLAAFAVSCLAGNGFDLLAGPPLSHRVASRSRLAVFAVVALAVALSAVLAFSGRLGGTSGGAWGPFVGVVILGAAALGWARLSVTSWLGSRVKAAGWVALVVIDLGWVNLAQLEARPEDEVLGERVELAQTIASGAELERVFSPSYSLPQQTAALEGLELADGVNPLQLASYRDHLAEATGFPVAGYSVTLPPFPSGTPSVPWTVHIDPASLGVLNVATIISEYPLEGQGLEPATRVDGTWVYHNPLVRPRAWVEPTASAVESWIPAVKVVWSPNRISVEAEGPGTLVVSENAYPGWTVTVDGKESELLTVHGLLRGVDLSEGGHEVVFTFRPRSVYVGALLVLGSAVVLLALWRLR